MMDAVQETSQELADRLGAYIDRYVAAHGGSTAALKPNHRVKLHWPPHPVSYSYHVLSSDWTGKATFEAHGDTFQVDVANSSYGVFGRCEEIWLEARGRTVEEMLANMREAAEPLFKRQLAINQCLEQPGRFTGHFADLERFDLLRLLYCEDRDVANEARSDIEINGSSGVYFDSLILILDDRKHPNRRSAQWCVLDIFEALPSVSTRSEEQREAVRAMKSLIWDAEDDYARTIYKAGVVLGGHLPDLYGGPTLIDCLNAPSRIGRRSAVHGLFHVVEWVPSSRGEVVDALRKVAEDDPEPLLRGFACAMASDIAAGATDHVVEPVFPDEA